ncbi:DUF4380 domain-containing protein [Flavitalea antarctica]
MIDCKMDKPLPQITKGTYNGWDVHLLENEWVKLFVAPQFGGRLIQLELDNHQFFFCNKKLKGISPDDTRLGENGSWLNYGGEKVWPAPQGWNSPGRWPGPPDPVLDGGEYQCDLIAGESKNQELRLVSPFDPFTGLQIEKRIKLHAGSTAIDIRVLFHNMSDKPVEWSVWPVCQLDAPDRGPENQYYIVCPLNPASLFEGGYKVMHGLVNNPQNELDAYGNLIVNFKYLVGKLGLDSNGGWIAYHARNEGKVLVLNYQYQDGEPYPDNTSIHIWTQGKGQIFSRNRLMDFADDQELNPPYLEMELLSPLKEIFPGGVFEFNYQVQTCTVPTGVSIQRVNERAVICEPLQISFREEAYFITGQYGLFQKGTLVIKIEDENGSTIEFDCGEVSPLQGVRVERLIYHNTIPAAPSEISLLLVGKKQNLIGIIDRSPFINNRPVNSIYAIK